DEALMQDSRIHEFLDRTLWDLQDNDHPFNGVTVVFGGDFQQMLPVVPKGSPQNIINASLPKSYIWNHISIFSHSK
ncbi:hypothetical protein GYMLUDRAFT_168294, partial [Collybiopsis luxurians FD-317 M1]